MNRVVASGSGALPVEPKLNESQLLGEDSAYDAKQSQRYFETDLMSSGMQGSLPSIL